MIQDSNTPGAPVPNVQAGQQLGQGDPAERGVIDTGDRRDQVRYEADPDQLVRAKHLFKPEGPLPPEEQSANTDVVDHQAGPPIEDVEVAPESSSVWDARPPADDQERSGNPTGH